MYERRPGFFREDTPPGHRAEATEGYDVCVFGLQRIGIRDASQKNTGSANLMTLLQKLTDERDGFASTATPDDMVTVANDSG